MFENSLRNATVQKWVSQHCREWSDLGYACFYGNSNHHSRVSDETRKQAFNLQKERASSLLYRPRMNTLSCCAQYTTYRAFGLISVAFEELLRWGFAIRFATRRPLQWYIYHYDRPSNCSHIPVVFWSCKTILDVCVEGLSVPKGLMQRASK